MSFHHIVGVAAGVLALAEFVFYILAMYGRDYRLHRIRVLTTPNRATWLIWAALGIITAVSYWSSGATDTVWFAGAYALGFFVVALLSIKRGEGGFEAADLFCLIGAAVSAWLWWKYNSPETALYATLAIDAFGIIPTLKKSWKRPEGENRLAWTMTTAASALNLLALNWSTATFAIGLYPVYMLVANGLVVAFLYRKHT